MVSIFLNMVFRVLWFGVVSTRGTLSCRAGDTDNDNDFARVDNHFFLFYIISLFVAFERVSGGIMKLSILSFLSFVDHFLDYFSPY